MVKSKISNSQNILYYTLYKIVSTQLYSSSQMKRPIYRISLENNPKLNTSLHTSAPLIFNIFNFYFQHNNYYFNALICDDDCDTTTAFITCFYTVSLKTLLGKTQLR